MNKKFILKHVIFIIILFLIIMPFNVSALRIESDGTLYYKDANISVSGKGSCHDFSVKKVLGSNKNEVYCVINEEHFHTNNGFGTCSDSDTTKIIKSPYKKVSGITKSNVLRIAGEAVEIIDDKSWENNKKYLFKTATLNVLFNKTNCSYSSDGKIKDIISKAVTKYKTKVENEQLFKQLKFENSNSVMGKTNTSKRYISDIIVLNSLMKKLNDADVTYTFSTNLKSGAAYLCTKSDGTGCTALAGATLSGVTSKNYYVRVDNGTAGEIFDITVSGKSTYKYPTGKFYCHATDSYTWQPLFELKQKDKNVSVSKKISLKIPEDEKPEEISHNIQIMKVNSDGEAISGAQFRITEQGTNNSIDLRPNSSNPAIFEHKYTSTNGVDTFINKKYCIEETQSPKGYIKNKASEKNCYPITNETTTICYKQSENSETAIKVEDKNYCNASLTCPEGYTLDSTDKTKCLKEVEVATVEICENGSTPNEHGCLERTDNATIPEGSTEPTCPEGTIQNSADPTKCDIYVGTKTSCEDSSITPNNEGKCIKVENNSSICKGGEGAEDHKYCENMNEYSFWKLSGGNIFIRETNEKNKVVISKKDATGGSEEVSGAELKICSLTKFQSDSDKCTAATTIDNEKLEWISSPTPQSFSGIEPGDYVIIETLPPNGYKLKTDSDKNKTVTKFHIDEDGKVTTTGKTETVKNGEESTDIIVIDNNINEVSISKTDIVTTKEIPGATISICNVNPNYKPSDSNDDSTSESTEESEEDTKDNTKDNKNSKIPEMETDMDGNCVPTKLADGSTATWVSTNEPHKVQGLPAGTYYLVEITAPKGYSTAEAIKFVMKEDGTLTDEKGNSLKDNKIVMKDKPISDVKTGDILLLVFTAFGLIGLGFGSYYYFNNKDDIMKKLKRFGKANA